jgi:hypothetical protein
LRDSVTRTFLSDLSAEDWPLISILVDTYRLALFLENTQLFFLAIKHDRPDFLLKFRVYLSQGLRHVKPFNYGDINQMTLLEYALHMSDLISVRAILLSWVEILNTDSNDLLTQNVFHPCYFFLSLSELKPLSRKYPVEYLQFISAIRLVRNHPSLLEDVKELQLNNKDRYEISGCDALAATYTEVWKEYFRREALFQRWTDVWAQIFFGRPSGNQPVTSLFLPIRTPAALGDGFGVFADVSEQLQNVDIFDSPVGVFSVQYFWELHSANSHITSMLRYILLHILFMLFLYSYQFFYVRGRSLAGDIAMYGYIAVVIVIFAYYILEEFRQLASLHYDFKSGITWQVVLSHFARDMWNVVDVLVSLAGIIGLAMVLVVHQLSNSSRCLLSLCSVLMWFKILYYLRPFSSSGPLGESIKTALHRCSNANCDCFYDNQTVVMILKIAYEIRFFILVLFCVLCGFAQAFWLLSNKHEDLEFGTVSKAVLNAFLYMLGNINDSTFSGTVAPAFATALLVVFLIFMMILMLNLLIALMGDTFSIVRSQGQALWRKEQAAIIFEQCFLLEKTINTHEFIHVLKYTSDIQIAAAEKEVRMLQSVQESAAHVSPFTPVET